MNNVIELKTSLKDSLASAANYINKIGWIKNTPCLYRVTSQNKIKDKYINKSARNISHRMSVLKWKKLGIICINKKKDGFIWRPTQKFSCIVSNPPFSKKHFSYISITKI